MTKRECRFSVADNPFEWIIHQLEDDIIAFESFLELLSITLQSNQKYREWVLVRNNRARGGNKQKNRSIRIAIVNRDLMFYCDVRCLSLFFIYVKLIDISMVMRLVFRGRRRWETRRCKTCKSTSWRRSVKFVRVNWLFLRYLAKAISHRKLSLSRTDSGSAYKQTWPSTNENPRH